MNEVIFSSENFNIISGCFLKNNKPHSQLYDWYLPYSQLDKLYLNDDIKIRVNGQIKKVRVMNLSYSPYAEAYYKEFPIVKNQPGWQIRLICRLLLEKGYKPQRERCFKGLKNTDGMPLRVDISFQKDTRWHLIEYHGTHHYFRRGATIKRFSNIRRIMKIKQIWCIQNGINYLEIPFYQQGEIPKIIEQFLE